LNESIVAAVSAKKALKKLKKKAEKAPSRSAKQLMRLGKSAASTITVDNSVKREVKDISQQAVISAISELATPLNPVLSWFNEGGDHRSLSTSSIAATPSIRTMTKLPSSADSKLALVRFPLKSPPCKRCPALSNGICKCAAKKFNFRA